MKKFLEKWQWLIALLSAAGLITVALTKNPVKTAVQNTVSDLKSETKIMQLHPAAREAARKFLNSAEAAGFKLRVTSSYRDYAEQNKLYAQGRTSPGAIVTNAKGGQSYHNFGLALDVVPLVAGVPDWQTSQWPQIAAIGKAAGFAWGGDFKSFIDKPHFQLNTGLTLAQLQTRHATGQTDNGYVLLT